MRFPPPRRAAAPLAVALVAVLMTPAAASGGGRSQPPPQAPVSAGEAARPPVVVTLLTGDRVTVTSGSGGPALTVDAIRRRPGATGSVRVAVERGDTYVYPEEALPYIATDRIDRQLFNVSRLVADGYDDAHSDELPLIVTREEAGSATARGAGTGRIGARLPGAETALDLRSVDGEAVRAERSRSAEFWSALTGGGHGSARSSRKASGEAPEDTPPFLDGVRKIWLDGKAEAALADSTAHVGAPAAWSAGGTGAGVRVAVLDTGVDTTHPDLADRITTTRSFVPGENVLDRHGHGTHVASTVVGTGAASGGKERGLAPGADLVVGKVLGNDGIGSDSGIIAGMEWAARDAHAAVINMSLGNRFWRTQDDPMSEAANRLSEETGALFVVAAGNAGPGPSTVTSPATAEAALAVGSVDTSDVLAPSSSAGPRAGDDGLKPDLTAPGVGVLAARSQYTSEGEGTYMELSGTSMAAPHVAGAAVLLAQKHPGWTGRQIKDALMSTTVRTPGYSPYQAGTGRLDVAAAYLGDQVVATGSVDAGPVTVPHGGADPAPVERKITYTNTTKKAVTLTLAVDRGDTPAGVFTPDADRVTVPAQGSATVGLLVDVEGLATGRYTAQVVARHAGGTVHTVAAVAVEPEKHRLTVRLKGPDGKPLSGEVEITGPDGDTSVRWAKDGVLTGRWTPGSYTAVAAVEVRGAHGPHSLGYALLTLPDIDLTKDREVELDASKARQVKAETPRAATVVDRRIDVYRSTTLREPAPGDSNALHQIIWPAVTYDSVWVLPGKDKVKKGSFVLTTRVRALQTPLRITYPGQRLDDVLVPQPGSAPLADGATRLDAVDAGRGTPSDYAGTAARGRVAVVRADLDVSPADRVAAARAAGAAMLLVVNDGAGRRSEWYGAADGFTPGPLPVVSVTKDEGDALTGKIRGAATHRVALTVESRTTPEYLYDLVRQHRDAVAADPSFRTDPGSLARIDQEFGRRAAPMKEIRDDIPPYGAAPTSGRIEPFPWRPLAPGTRTDWVSAGDGIRWRQSVSANGWSAHTDAVAYRPGSVQKDQWFGPVMRPRLTADELPIRTEASLGGPVMPAGDGGAGHSGYSPWLSSTLSVYQGDTLVGRAENASQFAAFDLAPGRLPYRLVLDTAVTAQGREVFGPYSTATRTEWRFHSEATAGPRTVPLVQLDYGIDLDAEGRAKRTSDLVLTPVALGGDRSAPTSVVLDVSYDDGATWQRQDLREDRGTWRAKLKAPSRAGYVSLRVVAGQRDGDGVTQTVTRAFGLR
ncbi:S8 family serine peptidase [Streptomyces althioticus]|uniref:S8 family serine peptidase n=1 Tax=Streptomyces althioticus TaxID=83380 RepID=UPI003404171F